ncbi:oxygenase MpaB family protein [Nocardioides solisilvae]|uniref:oxygenase MpaB family protein n=1 Tax=Nocardioides solisilvae TaxID=1542435 RepID=UPI000D74F5B8|nr:oxygenase MpaB family protein [Nocardioides solisilvae]
MTQTTPTGTPGLPTSVRFADEARPRFPTLAPTYLAAMRDGDPLADAFVADFPTLGRGRAMRMLRTACREGIGAVPDAPASLRALFAELDAVPDWVDLDEIDETARHLGRYTRQAGIVLGAASLVSGYANSAASRPLEMTGRYLDDAGARTIEVGSWLVEATRAGGLHRHAPGFELTVRVRLIHALVRAALRDDERWDEEA